MSASCPGPVFRHRREEAGPSSGGGVGETDPEAGGEPPVNTPALLKPDSAVDQRPGIWIKNLAWGGTTDQKIKKGVKLLSICLFITAVTSPSCVEFTLLPKEEDVEECLWKVLNSHHLKESTRQTLHIERGRHSFVRQQSPLIQSSLIQYQYQLMQIEPMCWRFSSSALYLDPHQNPSYPFEYPSETVGARLNPQTNKLTNKT